MLFVYYMQIYFNNSLLSKILPTISIPKVSISSSPSMNLPIGSTTVHKNLQKISNVVFIS